MANAGADQVIPATGPAVLVTLDGSASSDPDGDTLTFSWTDGGGRVIGTTAIVQVTLPLGVHLFHLSVSDGMGGTSSDDVSVTVADAAPPVLSVPADITTPALRPAGAPVVFAVTAVDAVDGTLPVTCTPASGSTFVIGVTTVMCVATDASGNAAQGQFKVTVTNRPTPGRMEGAGRVEQGELHYAYDFHVREFHIGFVLGHFDVTVCRPGRGRYDRDDCDEDNRDRWRHGDGHRRDRFEARRFTFVRFSDDQASSPDELE